MKQNYLKLISSLVLVFLFATGCHKDHDCNECRLVFGTNADPAASANFTFHYNDRGLANVWDIENYGTFTQEYGAGGKLKKSTFTQNGEVLGTTSFFYDGGDKVAKEINFGAGADTIDITYYHYDVHGNLVKVQSFMNDYIALGKYTPDGNLSSSELFSAVFPFIQLFISIMSILKNPYLAIPGIDHLFPYYTPMDLFYGRLRWASLKQVGYDENGDPIVQFEYDPSQTVWQGGPHNYPALVTYFDLIVGGWFPYKFEFENCGEGNGNSISPKVTLPTSNAGNINLMMLLKRNPAKSMKEQVQEWRQQFRNIKNSGINN